MLAAVLVSGLLTACGTTTPGGTSVSDARGDIDRLYKQAREELASGNNEAAVKTLERVEARSDEPRGLVFRKPDRVTVRAQRSTR